MISVMRKLTFCICENKGADQLHGNRKADLRCNREAAGAQFEGDLGEILALGAEISPYIGLREKWESP